MSFLVKYERSASGEDECRIALGKGRFALVDKEDFDELNKHRWFCKLSNCCWYAVRKKWIDGKCVLIRMHREIMNTPQGFECHHIYCDSLDNRKAYLQNVGPQEHREIHRTKIFFAI